MIIFDLDGTLADCEHRRHFVDPSKRDDCYYHYPATLTQSEGWYYSDVMLMCHPSKAKKFIPDWPAFFESCDRDKRIHPVCQICSDMICNAIEIQIWSGRCESVRAKTIGWLEHNVYGFEADKHILKMRPIGDNTPDDQLKEKWLDEAMDQGQTIDYVFDDRPKVVRMWRRRGIFVFDCNQLGKEF